jgi:hypothetical protein
VRRGGVPQQIKERTFHRIAVLRIVEDIVGYRGSHGGNTGSSPVGSANKISRLGYDSLTCSVGVRQNPPTEALGEEGRALLVLLKVSLGRHWVQNPITAHIIGTVQRERE